MQAGFFVQSSFFFNKEKRCEAAVVTGGSWCWAFFLEQKIGVLWAFFFLAEKSAAANFFFSRKESQIIFGYTFFIERFS